MKRELFDALIGVLKSTRGPKPQRETVEEAFKHLNGQSKHRYGVRLAGKLIEIHNSMKKYTASDIGTFFTYVAINGVSCDNAKAAVIDIIDTGCSINSAADKYGCYSARVHKLYTRSQKLKKLITEWESQDGRNYNA